MKPFQQQICQYKEPRIILTPSINIKGAEMTLTIPATENEPKRTLLALIDSGTSVSLISHDAVNTHNKTKNVREQHGQRNEAVSRRLPKHTLKTPTPTIHHKT